MFKIIKLKFYLTHVSHLQTLFNQLVEVYLSSRKKRNCSKTVDIGHGEWVPYYNSTYTKRMSYVFVLINNVSTVDNVNNKKTALNKMRTVQMDLIREFRVDICLKLVRKVMIFS